MFSRIFFPFFKIVVENQPLETGRCSFDDALDLKYNKNANPNLISFFVCFVEVLFIPEYWK